MRKLLSSEGSTGAYGGQAQPVSELCGRAASSSTWFLTRRPRLGRIASMVGRGGVDLEERSRDPPDQGRRPLPGKATAGPPTRGPGRRRWIRRSALLELLRILLQVLEAALH